MIEVRVEKSYMSTTNSWPYMWHTQDWVNSAESLKYNGSNVSEQQSMQQRTKKYTHMQLMRPYDHMMILMLPKKG